MMKVVTFNLRYATAEDGPDGWRHRKDFLADTIRTIDPDIMGVQECLPFQADEVKISLPHLDHFGLGRYHSIAVDRLHETYSGESCTIFFRSDRLTLNRCGTFWHSDTPDVPGSANWGNNLPRIATWGRFVVKDNGNPFFFCNTHFHWDEPYVTRAEELMVERITQLADGSPTVLVGDFNASPDSGLHSLLVSDDSCRLRDVWSALGRPEAGAGTSHGFTGEPQIRIDWILTSDDIRPLSIERCTDHRDGRYPSDHFPVVAEIEIEKEERAHSI